MVAEQRAAGASLTQIGRELDVRPDQLRAWVRAQREAHGAATALTGRPPSRNCGASDAKWRRCAKNRPSQQKWRCTSRKSHDEVRRDCSPPGRVPFATHVPRARRVGGRLLRVSPAAGALARDDRRRLDDARAPCIRREWGDVWCAAHRARAARGRAAHQHETRRPIDARGRARGSPSHDRAWPRPTRIMPSPSRRIDLRGSSTCRAWR